jgi:hypothetical protein
MFMSALGQKRTLRRLRIMSALPSIADIGCVRIVPKADKVQGRKYVTLIRLLALLNEIIREQQEISRNCDSKRLGGFEIYDQFNRSWLLDRQLPWVNALQNFIHVSRGAAVHL